MSRAVWPLRLRAGHAAVAASMAAAAASSRLTVGVAAKGAPPLLAPHAADLSLPASEATYELAQPQHSLRTTPSTASRLPTQNLATVFLHVSKGPNKKRGEGATSTHRRGRVGAISPWYSPGNSSGFPYAGPYARCPRCCRSFHSVSSLTQRNRKAKGAVRRASMRSNTLARFLPRRRAGLLSITHVT